MKVAFKNVYTCDFCNRKMFVQSAMVKHEKFCDKNPENRRACSFCIHLKEEKYDYERGYNYYNEPQYGSTKTFRCSVFDKKLYPVKVERRGYVQKYPWQFEDQEPMPKLCDKRDDIIF